MYCVELTCGGAAWIPATVLLRELQERGYDGGISQLRVCSARLCGDRKTATFARKVGQPPTAVPIFDAAIRANSTNVSMWPDSDRWPTAIRL
jgi:hypothetical protein